MREGRILFHGVEYPRVTYILKSEHFYDYLVGMRRAYESMTDIRKGLDHLDWDFPDPPPFTSPLIDGVKLGWT